MSAPRPVGLIGAGRAEFHKIWDSGVPAIILSVLPVASFLFVFELFHVEKATERLAQPGALEALGLLYFATWKTLLLPTTVVAFAAYWTTVDCQYGMIRVASCQPLTRATYLTGKWLGIGAWVALFTAAFVAVLVAWTMTYVGIDGLGAAGVMTIPLGELPAPPGILGDSPWLRGHTVVDFHLTAVATPALFLVPALLYFMRRDIDE